MASSKDKFPYSSKVRFLARNIRDKSYTTGYYGTQEVRVIPPGMMEIVKAAPQYIDLTAGGASFPYHRARLGQDVGVNDRCYYAHLSQAGVFDAKMNGRDQRIYEWFEEFCRKVHPDNVEGIEGWIFNAQDSPWPEPEFSEEVAKYLDALLLSGDEMVIMAVGKMLVGTVTWRGLGWYNKTAVTGETTSDLTLQMIYDRIVRAAWRTRAFAEMLPRRDQQAHFGDALAAIANMRIEKDAVMYIDPAWPWLAMAAGNAANPYMWFTYDLGSVLLQKTVPRMDDFWTAETPFDKILNDVSSWMTAAFERGAAYFIVSTQDTNYPVPEEVYAELDKRFTSAGLEVRRDAVSHSANKVYGDYFGAYKA